MSAAAWLYHAHPAVPAPLLAPLVAALDDGLLPALSGVDGAVVARWLYRAAMAGSTRWGPLAVVDPRRMGPDPGVVVEELLRAVVDGWLVFHPAGPEVAGARAAGVSLLQASEGPPWAVEPDFVSDLMEADAIHLVATDPALEQVRRALAAHVSAAGLVLLTGPSGTGKASLGAWAHAGRDARPLSVVYPRGPARPQDGCWALFEEVSELSSDQVTALRLHLDRRLRPPPPRRTVAGKPRPLHPAFASVKGESAALAEVLQAAVTAAPTLMPVLLLGEPGTGKERMARALHEASGRTGEFVGIDLSATPDHLFESELFGWVDATFSGVKRARLGAIRTADGGTLFLDELGNLSFDAQSKLLRVLSEQAVRPLGSDKLIPVSVRVIAATNAPVELMAARGEFRGDLLKRLDNVVLRLPPLRERGDDVLLLAEELWRAARPGLGATWCTAEAREALLSHNWPGNVRELIGLISAAAAGAPPGPLQAGDLGPLAPENRRPVPLLVTHSGEGPPAVEGLLRPHQHALSSVVLRLPPLAARGAGSLRHHLLHALCGLPLRADALALLESLPWRGNGPQVAAVAAALRAGVPAGPLDAATVRRLLPQLAQEGAAPIRALMHPTRRSNGEVGGWVQDFEEAGVLVGRARSFGELVRTLGEADERVRAIRDRLGSAQPASLPVGGEERVSRAHALVMRQGEDLVVVGIPGAEGTRAGPIRGPLRPVGAGAAVSIGRAGRLEIGPADKPLLRLWFFSGALAFAQEAEASLEGSGDGAVTIPAGTYAALTAPPLAIPAAPSQSRIHSAGRRSQIGSGVLVLPRPRGRHVWLLDAAEIALLNGLIMAFRGGDFSGWLEDGLKAAGGPASERLRSYLVGSRAAQYCGRLFQYAANIALREDLLARMGPNPAARRRLLPTAIDKELFSTPKR